MIKYSLSQSLRKLLILLLVTIPIALSAQTITSDIDLEPCFRFTDLETGTINNTGVYCEDETVRVVISNFTGPTGGNCGINPGNAFVGEERTCGVWPCTSITLPDIDITYTGGEVLFHTITYEEASPTVGTCTVGGQVIIDINPSTDGILTVEWSTQTIVHPVPEGVPPGGCDPDITYVTNYNVSGAASLQVLADPNPTLTALTQVVQPGDWINLQLENCSPYLEWGIEESCNYSDNPPFPPTYNCQFSTSPTPANIRAPEYTTELTFRAYYRRNFLCPGADVKYTNEVTVRVEEQPAPNACGEPVLSLTESMLQDEDLIQERSDPLTGDYHRYTVTNTICDNNTATCSIESAWNFLSSTTNYMIPSIREVPSPIRGVMPFSGSNIIFEGGPFNVPISNCLEGFVGAPFERIILGLTGRIELFQENIGNLSTFDPIKIVIDEDCKCITNYTLPGHIYHPGKIRRCIRLNNCNEVVIETTGTGFTQFGNSALGKSTALANVLTGIITFNNLDDYLIENFNQ